MRHYEATKPGKIFEVFSAEKNPHLLNSNMARGSEGRDGGEGRGAEKERESIYISVFELSFREIY